jgi:hypothetical protein
MKMISFILLTAVWTFTASCRKDAEPVSAASTHIQKEIVASNAWKVSSFIDNGQDQTSDFSTYLLQLNSDGSAVATSSGIGILYYGAWNMISDKNSGHVDSRNYQGGNNNKLIINLIGNHHMDEISESWKIVKLTDNGIWLLADKMTSPKEIHLSKN